MVVAGLAKVLTSVMALNWTVAATGDVEEASPLLEPKAKLAGISTSIDELFSGCSDEVKCSKQKGNSNL